MINKYISKIFRFNRKLQKIFYKNWNRFKFISSGIKLGNNSNIYNDVYLNIHCTAKITIGNDFIFTSGEAFNPLSRNIKGCIYAESNAQIKIGNNTGMSSPCIWAKNKIHIGNNVNIGGDCILIDTDAHNLDYLIRRDKTKLPNMKYNYDSYSANSAPIIIEDDVLIGTRTIILKGVTIGARSVIGAGSVVTHSVPADCIAAGNPCKLIRKF